MNESRYNRQEQFFGEVGQQKISKVRVAVIGAGGLGGHVIQQLALLGVQDFVIIDSEDLAESNRNRYVTARNDDPVPGSRKVDLAERMITEIDPKITVNKEYSSFVTDASFKKIINVDYVFGCLDTEGARLILNELCSAYALPYFDLASEIIPGNPGEFGGRLFINLDGQGCLVCQNVIDLVEAQNDLLSQTNRNDRDNLYGVNNQLLNKSGPSVVSINGIVASLAVTEFMVAVTGIRSPKNYLFYRGQRGIVTISQEAPNQDCYYCKGIRNKCDEVDVQRYVRNEIGKYV